MNTRMSPCSLSVSLLVALVIQRSVGVVISNPHRTDWLDYACKDNGTISAVNPDPSVYMYAKAVSFTGECNVQMSDMLTTLKISDCDTFREPIEITLSSRPIADVVQQVEYEQEVFTAHCNVRFGWYTLSRMNMVILPTWVSTNDSIPAPENFDVTYKLRDLTGEEGYTAFSIGYPIGFELNGPPGLRIKPRQCRAVTGHVVNDAVNREVVIRFGCSVSLKTILDFSEEGVEYDVISENAADAKDPSIDLLEELSLRRGMQLRSQNESVDPSTHQQTLYTTMFATRYFDSKTMNIVCMMHVCPVGDPACDFNCEDWRARKELIRSFYQARSRVPDSLNAKPKPNYNMRQVFRGQMQLESLNPDFDSHIHDRQKLARTINKQAMGRLELP